MGFRVWGLGFRVWGFGFRVWGLGFTMKSRIRACSTWALVPSFWALEGRSRCGTLRHGWDCIGKVNVVRYPTVADAACIGNALLVLHVPAPRDVEGGSCPCFDLDFTLFWR